MYMTTTNYFQVTGVIFAVIGLLHLLRLVRAWDAQIGDFAVPLWLSVLAVIVAAYLAWNAFQLGQKS